MTADAVSLPLDRITPNPDYQPRAAGLSESHIRLLMESEPQTWPPVIVSPAAGGRYDLIDGFHRYEAARRMKRASLLAAIEPEAGYPESVAANLHHGLPLALADRKDAARWWHEAEPSLSYRDIGRRVGLSHNTVKAAIQAGQIDRREPEPPDALSRLVKLAYRAYRDGEGRSLLGLGKDGSAAAFRRVIDHFDKTERPAVAHALAAYGRACIAASEPYLSKKG